MKKIILFSTLGCHLCEQAKDLVWPIASHLNYRIDEVDIADSDELMERYGVSIPVLALVEEGDVNDGANRKDATKELFWPFDSDQVAAFIAI